MSATPGRHKKFRTGVRSNKNTSCMSSEMQRITSLLVRPSDCLECAQQLVQRGAQLHLSRLAHHDQVGIKNVEYRTVACGRQRRLVSCASDKHTSATDGAFPTHQPGDAIHWRHAKQRGETVQDLFATQRRRPKIEACCANRPELKNCKANQ